jgi:hypothetical protein
MQKPKPGSHCECSKNNYCPDAQELWRRVESTWDNLVAVTEYRPAYIDDFQECMRKFREHRKGLTGSKLDDIIMLSDV